MLTLLLFFYEVRYKNKLTLFMAHNTPCPEKGATIFLPLTSPSGNRQFSNFFHHQI